MKRTMHIELFVYILSLWTTLPSVSGAVGISNSVNSSIILPRNPFVKKGDSKEAVDQLLGFPKGGFKSMNEETAYYEKGYVLFRDGRAARWSILSDEELQAKRLSDDDVYSSVVTSQSIPRSSPQELAYREKLAQQQQIEREQERLRAIPYYERGDKERKQYQEDAAFMRSLFAEGKNASTIYVPHRSDAYPVNRSSFLNEDAYAVTPQVPYQNYVSSDTVVPAVGNQGYVNNLISTPLIKGHGYVNNSFSANRIGGSTFFSDGTSAQRIGNFTFFSDGFSANRTGNNTFFSDGTSAQRIGNNTYFNNGVSAQQIGNMTFFSDGTSANRIGNMTFYNK